MAISSQVWHHTATAQNTEQSSTVDPRTPAQLPSWVDWLHGILVVGGDGNIDRIYVQAGGLGGSTKKIDIDTTAITAAGIAYFPVGSRLDGGATVAVSAVDGAASAWKQHDIILIVGDGAGLPMAAIGGSAAHTRTALSNIGTTLSTISAAVVSGLETSKNYSLAGVKGTGTTAVALIVAGACRIPDLPEVMICGAQELCDLLGGGREYLVMAGGQILTIEASAPAGSGSRVLNCCWAEIGAAPGAAISQPTTPGGRRIQQMPIQPFTRPIQPLPFQSPGVVR